MASSSSMNWLYMSVCSLSLHSINRLKFFRERKGVSNPFFLLEWTCTWFPFRMVMYIRTFHDNRACIGPIVSSP
jgi:hypothetical protein